ncbi:hypothetical protein [Sinimarinibacterium flocculans]|uniref:hypothetical protein n=1 Tax=Sinimarinibacterium flocculans TaxID=985250 RepID=UPI0035164376
MRNWMKAGLVAVALATLPAAPAMAIGFVKKIPAPPQPVSVCTLPSALSLFCFLGL